jgi:serine/threonine protein kinase
MTADSDNIHQALSAQLSSLDENLGANTDDFEMLADIQKGIGRLLAANGDKEGEVRRILQERFDKGELRKETYQLVKSMLDRYVTENLPTSSEIEEIKPVEAVEPIAQAAPVEPIETVEPIAVANAPDDDVIEFELVAEDDTAIDTYVEPVVELEPIVEMELVSEVESAQDEEKSEAELDEPEEDEPDEFTSTSVLPNEILRPPTADDRVQVGSVLRDRFLLQERVSGGSMGVVYRAMDRRLAEAASTDPWVAIKVLSPQLSQNGTALRALQQEAAKGRCLVHPGIVRFIDLDRDDDLYFIIMEWLEGRTLADILDSPEGKNITVERAIDIVRQIGKALDYAHKCGIVHADVKPGNVMELSTGDTKIFDFGIARVLQSQGDDSTFDPGVMNAMTPEYSSVEVLRGEEPAPSDDVFSLGCLLYRLVAGYRVFGPRDAAEAAEEGMKPQRLKELPEHQWRALRKAISFSRDTRFPSMTEFLDALDNMSDDTVSFEVDDDLDEDKKSGRKGLLIGLIAIPALLAIAGYQFGVADMVMDYFIGKPQITQPVIPAPEPEDPQAAALRESAESFSNEAVSISEPEATEIEAEDAPGVVEPITILPEEPVAPIVDFRTLPAPDFELPLAEFGRLGPALEISIREDGAPVVVDLVRPSGFEYQLDVRIDEIGYSGNRSPWGSGQFEIADDGFVSFPAGQERARVVFEMASDPLREADQQSTLLIREADSANTELAKIEIALEDDDQRAFESSLPRNTVAFAVSQVAVAERDPAVQLDILRFNPGNQPIVVGYSVKDITATEGQDYFSPGGYSISFAPGQRTARLLIPLVQDSVAEGDEAFTVELATSNADIGGDVYQRIVIMIRDDDTPRQ